MLLLKTKPTRFSHFVCTLNCEHFSPVRWFALRWGLNWKLVKFLIELLSDYCTSPNNISWTGHADLYYTVFTLPAYLSPSPLCSGSCRIRILSDTSKLFTKPRRHQTRDTHQLPRACSYGVCLVTVQRPLVSA